MKQNKFFIECFSTTRDPSLVEAWRELEKSGVGTAFQKLDYVSAVHDAFLREGPDRAWYILLREQPSGRPVMVMPMVEKTRLGTRILETMDYDVVDYGGALHCADAFSDSTDARHASEMILDFVADYDVLAFRNWTDGSCSPENTLPLFDASPGTRGDTFSVPLAPGTFEKYRKSNSAFKQAMKKLRRMKKEFGAEVVAITDHADIDTAFDAMLEQRRVRFRELGQTDSMADPRRQKLFRSIAHQQCAQKGALFLGIKIDGSWIATSFAVIHNGVMHAQLSSFANGPWTRHSPGVVTMALEIDWAQQNGLEKYDLGPGESHYKERFGVDRASRMIVNEPLTSTGKIYLAAHQSKQLAKHVIKNIFGGVPEDKVIPPGARPTLKGVFQPFGFGSASS